MHNDLPRFVSQSAGDESSKKAIVKQVASVIKEGKIMKCKFTEVGGLAVLISSGVLTIQSYCAQCFNT